MYLFGFFLLFLFVEAHILHRDMNLASPVWSKSGRCLIRELDLKEDVRIDLIRPTLTIQW